MRSSSLPFLSTLPLLLIACSSSSAPPETSPDAEARDVATLDASPRDSAIDSASDVRDASTDVDKAAMCAASFGDSLTNAFGRLDGTVLAVVPPNDQVCAMPNMTHLVLQVVWNGAAYRMVLDVLSDTGSPDVSFYEMNAPLVGGAWASGWHAAITLDYVTTLALHSTSFTAYTQADLVAKVTSEIALGSKVSVFATSMDEPSSAHLIHRNITGQDGAIVIGPDTASPHYLLFRFAEQTF